MRLTISVAICITILKITPQKARTVLFGFFSLIPMTFVFFKQQSGTMVVAHMLLKPLKF